MILALAAGFSGQGHKVVIVTWDKLTDQPFYPIDSKYIWHRLGYSAGLVNKLQRVAALTKVLKAEKVDTLIGFVMSGDLTVFTAAKIASVTVIAAERNAPAMYEMIYSPLRRAVNFLQLHLADHVVVQFPRYASGYPAALHSRIVSIPNPVARPAAIARPDVPDASGRFRLLCVSRLDRRQKQIDVLIRAFAELGDRFPQWYLSIIGEGPERNGLEALAADLEVDGRVIFQGASQRVFEEYAASNLFVLPSAWEGFPNALAEAMAHGLPGVGFGGADGVADLVGSSNGWLAEGRGDPAKLAASLAEAMSSPTTRRIRGEAAASTMGRYRNDDVMARWLELAVGHGGGRD